MVHCGTAYLERVADNEDIAVSIVPGRSAVVDIIAQVVDAGACFKAYIVSAGRVIGNWHCVAPLVGVGVSSF